MNTHTLRCQALFWASACALAAALLWWFLRGLSWDSPRYALDAMLDGSAHRPFVTRALVALMARLLIALLPIGGRAAVTALMYGSLLGFIWSLRLLARSFWPPSARLDAAVLLSLPGLIPLMLGYRIIYDFVTLFLFTLCLALITRQRWGLFLAAYVLSCVNRETTALLSLVFLATCYDQLPWRRLLALGTAQALIFIVIRGGLAWQFRNNPGGSFEFNLLFQIIIFLNMPLDTAAHSLLATAATMLVAAEFRRKPRFLRRAFLVLAPALLALYMVFGNPWEIRVFYELYPVIFLLAFRPGWIAADSEAHV